MEFALTSFLKRVQLSLFKCEEKSKDTFLLTEFDDTTNAVFFKKIPINLHKI